MKRKFRIIAVLLLAVVSCQIFTGCELPTDIFNNSSENNSGLTAEELEFVSNRYLVPQLITYERFVEEILTPLKEEFGDALYEPAETRVVQDVQMFLIFYSVLAKEDLGLSENEKCLFGVVLDNLIMSDREYTIKLRDYPIIEQYDVCVFNTNCTIEELAHCEEIIRTYCPDYTYEDIYYDHALTEYDWSKSPVKVTDEQ